MITLVTEGVVVVVVVVSSVTVPVERTGSVDVTGPVDRVGSVDVTGPVERSDGSVVAFRVVVDAAAVTETVDVADVSAVSGVPPVEDADGAAAAAPPADEEFPEGVAADVWDVDELAEPADGDAGGTVVGVTPDACRASVSAPVGVGAAGATASVGDAAAAAARLGDAGATKDPSEMAATPERVLMETVGAAAMAPT